ncbi:hypothetical protein [Thermohalobaculum xanthum]|nr:hypothetical protein [Thermohalobaculum xanthum]
MKAFLAAIIIGAGLAVGAWFVLNGMGFSSADVYSTENVRL